MRHTPTRASRPNVTVSVVIPCRNEAHNLPDVIRMLGEQTVAPLEVIVADGMSTDGSREILEAFAAQEDNVLIIDNPDRAVSPALNLALAASSGDLVARMDTHARYDPDYLEVLCRAMMEKPEVVAVGGSMRTGGRGPWGFAIAATLGRGFGLGGARHRVGGPASSVNHVFSGCYRREVILAAGGWDPRLAANEDFEADQRVRSLGSIWLVPDAQSTWFVRESLPGLAKQMWRYGYYKGLTLWLHPTSLQVRQLAPPALIVGIALLAAIRPRLAHRALLTYLLASTILGGAAASADGASTWRGATVPPTVHVSWGLGLLVGLVRFSSTRVSKLHDPSKT